MKELSKDHKEIIANGDATGHIAHRICLYVCARARVCMCVKRER